MTRATGLLWHRVTQVVGPRIGSQAGGGDPVRQRRRARSRTPTSLYVICTTLILLVVAGCGERESTGDQGYIAGNGIVNVLGEAERERPGPVQGETLEGKPLSLDDYARKTVVINVWGSWCAPCRSEAPDLVEAAADLKDEGVEFFGINTRDSAPAMGIAFSRRYKVPYPSLFDESGRTLLAFQGTLSPSAIPSTLVIDAEGRVAASIIGETTKATLTGVVREVLEGS